MNIWIDVAHTPQYNFYKQFMLMLVEKGHTVHLTVLDRGPLMKIINRELADYQNQIKVYVIGKHRMKKISAIIDANLFRIIKLFFWLSGKHIDVAISNNLFTACLGWLFRIPNYAFGDDPQVFDYKPKLRFSNKSHYCLYEVPALYHISPKVEILPCLKEWAYLNPRTFNPNVKVLEKYGVQPKQYLFLREVSVGTVNYAVQSPQAILSISPLIQQFTKITQWGQSLLCNSSSSDSTITQKGQTLLCNSSAPDPNITYWGQSLLCNFKVLFSLEEKNRRSEYPADWILLQEPIEDIHSLMYYAAGLVSSGDSMAREAALLGIPAYYLGVRHSMPANLAASKVANLQNEKTQPFEQWLREVRGKSEEVRTKEQEEVRRKIDEEFIDINEYMLSLVENCH